MRHVACVVLSALALANSVPNAGAEEYPSKPIHLIIPFAAGGSADILFRAFAQRATLGQPFIIENVPGATGAIGLVRAAKSAPDGYTLTTAATSTFMVSPHINADTPYDPRKDFTPIAVVGLIPSVFVVNSKVPARSLAEFIAFARANPGKLNYASLGSGSNHQLMVEMLKKAAGLDIVHVAYKGSAQALMALLADEVQLFAFPAFVDAMGYLQNGQLRALGVATSYRSQSAPDVPTLTELGYNIVAPTWHVLVAPAGTPGAIVQRLASEVKRVNSLPEMKRILEKQGAESSSMTPAELKDYIAKEYDSYGRTIRELGIKGN